MKRLSSAVVGGHIETRVAIGAIRYGRKRRISRVVLIVGLGFMVFLVAVVLATFVVRPAHGAALGQVVCASGNAQVICPPSLEVGEPPAIPCPPEAVCLTPRSWLPITEVTQ